jgi:RecG-like helicase
VANIELTQLKGIGPSIVEKLNLIGIFNLRDLCFHLPFGYQDRTKITQIIDLQPGDEKLIKVKILSAQSLYRPRKMMDLLILMFVFFISILPKQDNSKLELSFCVTGK